MSRLIDEIFDETSIEGESIILEISSEKPETVFEFDLELDAIGNRIQKCIDNSKVWGIKKSKVISVQEAELQGESKNQKKGDLYRDRIGGALKRCKENFGKVHIEGTPGSIVGYHTPFGPRHIDIRLYDKLSGKYVNIEVKRGLHSDYSPQQRQKDLWLQGSGRGRVYIVKKN